MTATLNETIKQGKVNLMEKQLKHQYFEKLANDPIKSIPVGASCRTCTHRRQQSPYLHRCILKKKEVKCYNVCDDYNSTAK